MPRTQIIAALVASACLTVGCATLPGIAVSPVTGAVSWVDEALDEDRPGLIAALPIGMLMAPIWAFLIGITADRQAVENGGYGAEGCFKYRDVYKPGVRTYLDYALRGI